MWCNTLVVGYDDRNMDVWFVCAGVEKEKIDLLQKIEMLKEKVEYEMQPNIAFEEENKALQTKVMCGIDGLH